VTVPFTVKYTPFGVAPIILPDAFPEHPYGSGDSAVLKARGVSSSSSGYTTTVHWRKVTLPKGVVLSSTGVLSGTPSSKLVAGKSSISVEVTETITTVIGKKKIEANTTVLASLSLTIRRPMGWISCFARDPECGFRPSPFAPTLSFTHLLVSATMWKIENNGVENGPHRVGVNPVEGGFVGSPQRVPTKLSAASVCRGVESNCSAAHETSSSGSGI
jgi:hypothetical protein